MLFHSAAFKSKDIAPKLLTPTTHFSKVLQECDEMMLIFKIKQLLLIILSGFGSFLVLSSPFMDYLLVSRVLQVFFVVTT